MIDAESRARRLWRCDAGRGDLGVRLVQIRTASGAEIVCVGGQGVSDHPIWVSA